MNKLLFAILLISLLLVSVVSAAPSDNRGFLSFFDSFIEWLRPSSSPTGYVIEQNSNTVDFVPKTTVPVGCSDTDGANIPSEKGFLYFSDSQGELHEMFDHCVGNNLVEYFCVGDSFASELIACERSCSNGACVPLVLGDVQGYSLFEWTD